MAWTSRPIYLQCVQKHADAWQWIFPKILALTLFRNWEKKLRILTASNMIYILLERAGRAEEANPKWL